jgi:hypothetical protein
MKNDLGFDAVDAGSLDESWRQQLGTPVYGTDHNSECVRRALKEASSQRRSEFQATEKSPDLTRSPLKAGAMSKGLTKAGPEHQSHDGDRAIQGLDSSRANLRIRLSDFLKQPAD